MVMTEQTIYSAGECNIDIVGIRLRKRIGMITGIVGLIVLGVMFYFRIEPMYRFIATAGFAAGAALNFIQANERFCVANSLQGTMEIGKFRKKIERTPEELRKDRTKTMSVIVKTAITALAAGSFGLLPV
jgi:hypothetical protein